MVICLYWAKCKSSIEFQDLKEWRACVQGFVPNPPGFFSFGWWFGQLSISWEITRYGLCGQWEKQKSGGRNRASIAVMKMLDLDSRKNPPDPVQIIPRTTKKIDLWTTFTSHLMTFLAAYDIGQFGSDILQISSCLAEKFVGKFRGMDFRRVP